MQAEVTAGVPKAVTKFLPGKIAKNLPELNAKANGKLSTDGSVTTRVMGGAKIAGVTVSGGFGAKTDSSGTHTSGAFGLRGTSVPSAPVGPPLSGANNLLTRAGKFIFNAFGNAGASGHVAATVTFPGSRPNPNAPTPGRHPTASRRRHTRSRRRQSTASRHQHRSGDTGTPARPPPTGGTPPTGSSTPPTGRADG